MTTKVPLIGFDRYVDIEWCRSAIDAAANEDPIETVRNEIALTLPGSESQRKTLDILKRLTSKPFGHVEDFIGRGIGIYKRLGKNAVLPLIWGGALASYPFFGKSAETTGRLLSIQGDCSVKEIQRRIAEQYGDRHGIERAVLRVLQSMASWQALERDEENKRVIGQDAIFVADAELSLWLIEAALRYSGKSFSLQSLHSLPVLFPFALTMSLNYELSSNPNVVLRSEGPNNQIVDLKLVF